MIQVLSTKKIKKSRKKHRCNLCGGVIEPGDSYRKSRLKYDYDDPYEWKEGTACEIVAKELFGSGYFEDDGNGLTSETFEELAREIHEIFFMQDIMEINGITQSRYFRFSLHKIIDDLADQFKTHELVLEDDGGYFKSWVLHKRKIDK
jgi:hypothetical protein